MPAVWLPYGSTSISIRIDPDDLAWILPKELEIDYSALLPELRNGIKKLAGNRDVLLIDPTLPSSIREFLKNIVEKATELPYFDLLNHSNMGFSFKSACLISFPYLDPLIEFRGLGENLFPFHQTLWKDFRTHFLETSGSEKVDSKPYLDVLHKDVDLKMLMLTPWADSKMLFANGPLEAYETLKNIGQRFTFSVKDSFEILLISSGGNPFDESLIRAISVLPNCLQDAKCNRVLLTIEGTHGLGLDSTSIKRWNGGPDMPLILKYLELCRKLLNGKVVNVVSALPEPILNMVLDCKSYDSITDAYKASRLFLSKGSKVGVVKSASFTILKFENPNGVQGDQGT